MSDSFFPITSTTAPTGTISPTRDSVFAVTTQQTGADTTNETQRKTLEILPDMVAYEFGIVNVAASLNDSQLYRMIAGSTPQANQIPVVPPARGSVVGLGFRATENKTAGTASFSVFIGNAETTALVQWSTGTNKNQILFAQGTYGFSAGAELSVRMTTNGAFTPTTADVEVILYVLLDRNTTV